MTVFDGKAVISGAAQSDTGRKTGRSGMEHGIEGCLRAIADAGLTPDDVDGVASYPGPIAGEAGFVGATTIDMRDALGLRTSWFMAGPEGAAQLGPVVEACMAVTTGLANHVLCFRSVWESTAQMEVGRAAAITAYLERANTHLEYRAPFGAPSAANWIGIYAQRYMHEFGLTREQLAQIALNARRNAARNRRGIYTDPLTLDDYLSSRMISYPFCLYDCDVPADGCTAVIVSRRDVTHGLRRPPITVESVGTALYERHSWDQRADLTTMGAHDAAHSMWSRTSLTPADVDIAELYDGFSYLTVQWLEAMGFCEHGKVGPFIEGGHRIALDGELPINTQGGQLSSGRLHGLGFLHEACIQLWGDGGERQVRRPPEVAAVGIGGGPVAGSMLLTLRDARRAR
jgi:acetyl-CoA acetyltransferase